MILRLILGDQLNSKHSWYQEKNPEVLYFMAEMRQETDYVRHHIQKVIGFFAAMRNFSKELQTKGHKVLYYTLDDERNTQNLAENLQNLVEEFGIQKFEYQLPDEFRLDKQLETFCASLAIPYTVASTEHFYTSRKELTDFFHNKKQCIMEFFYRYMRKKHQVLMLSDGNPIGGKWNYDASNRKKWKGKPEIPAMLTLHKDVSELKELIERMGVETLGTVEESAFPWPTTREESLLLLNHFCRYLLPHFGDYQDAMDPNENYLFHSRLSFSLNTKMLSPHEVVDTAVRVWKENQKQISLSQIEGFVRQILGWREYMRGMYWRLMPAYEKVNQLQNRNPLPEFFWTGDTQMNCLRQTIKGSLENAYAHHIQRLMITGNYALLTQCHPDEVDAWYLGIYIDALQWVEITNTRGMSQWADGGQIATKPYVSSGSYINKMSNYCKGCKYKVSSKTGKDACPFNSLYWNFLDEKKSYFVGNNRMAMMINLLQKMDENTLSEHKQRAQQIIAHPERF